MLVNRVMGALGEPPTMDVADAVGLTTAQTAEADLLSVTGSLRGADV